ncbi:hypothetical protein ACFLUU_02480 [Chloroflexota bacterium]
MASISDIPELVKSMNYYFGEKWGTRIGKSIVLFVLVGIIAWAMNNVFVWINTLASPTSSTLLTAVILVLSVLLWVVVLFFISILLVFTLRIFGLPVRRSIESLLTRTRVLLLEALPEVRTEDAEKLTKLIIELDMVDKQWNDTRIVRFTRWMVRGRGDKTIGD